MFSCALKRFCRKCIENACDKWCFCLACIYWVNGKCTGDPWKRDGAWKNCRQGRRWRRMYEMLHEDD